MIHKHLKILYPKYCTNRKMDKDYWLLYVPPGLTFQNATFCQPRECVLYGSQNKMPLFPCVAQIYWFYN
jgi:hypothetical protein